MSHTTYVYPKICRAGLGNNLIIWARAELFAREHNLPLIAPRWSVFKIGPILRREKDWRLYGSLFTAGDGIAGLKRWLLFRRATIVGESSVESPLVVEQPGSRIIEFSYYSARPDGVYKFVQMGEFFAPLIAHADFLKKRLATIVAPEHQRVVDSLFNEPFIGIHFRRGDKPPLEGGKLYPPDTDHPTLPTEWYVAALKDTRAKLGYDAPAIVFTDGRPEQTAPLTSLPNVRVAPPNNALVDLLLMAKSKIFISTLSSSFSAWAAMLAKIPNIHYPGRAFHLVDGRPELTIMTDLDGRLPDSSAAILQAAMPRA